MRRDERERGERGQIEKERGEAGTFFRFGRYLSLEREKGKRRKEFEPQRESGKIMQTVRKRNTEHPQSPRPRLIATNLSHPLEAGGPGIPLADAPTRRGKDVSQRRRLVCGSCTNSNAYEGKGGRRERGGWLIRVDCGSAKAARIPGWLAAW